MVVPSDEARHSSGEAAHMHKAQNLEEPTTTAVQLLAQYPKYTVGKVLCTIQSNLRLALLPLRSASVRECACSFCAGVVVGVRGQEVPERWCILS